MSTSQDEDERKKRSLESGKEMLERYKAKRYKDKDKSMSMEQSDDESLHNEKSLLLKESEINEGTSSRDITYSSVSISEGEADADLEGLAGRVAELEELLEGKEAAVEALNEEIDHLRAEASSPNSSQSQSSSIHGRDIISLYHIKLQEFEKAVNQRDNLIEHLTSSLEQALSARDTVTAQLNALNSMQLTNPMVDNINLQQKIDVLEKTMNDQEALIRRLNAQLTDIHEHVQTLEMERETRNAEINDYKAQINNLNEQIRLGAAGKNINIDETLEQQKQYEARVDKIKQDMQHILNKFTTATNANAVRHQQELKDLTTKNEAEIAHIKGKHEEFIKILKDENKTLADRLNKELPDLESRHAKELSVFQTQLAHYKKTVEALKLELVNRAESQKIAQSETNLYKSKLEELKFEAENECRRQNLDFQKEKQLLNEQIKLHKIQLEEITSKHIATMSILESKESIERSLEQALTNAATLKQENDTLKFKLDDLSCRYSMVQSAVENSQAHERTTSGRIFDLERSLSRFDATSVSTNSELCETMYKTLDEEAIQYQLMRRNLEEKTEMEKLLTNKIRTLEECLLEANDELEQADLAKKAYEKQLKDIKNTSDKLQQEVNSLKESSRVMPCDTSKEECLGSAAMNIEGDSMRRIEDQQREIESLKLLLEQRETENASCKKNLAEIMDKTKKLEAQCDQLKDGLANAWAQCAEFEERLNQTMNDSNKVNASMNSTSSSKQLGTKESLNNSQSAADQDDGCLKNDHQNLYKELQQILEGESSLDEMKLKLCRYYSVCEKIIEEKAQFLLESASRKSQDGEDPLQKSLNNLCMEKKLLTQEIEDAMNRRKEELEAIKADSAKEINRLRLLLQNLKDGSASMNDLRAELEARHAKEMEELRTYFERKCLQMEKQYSEEVFSQQSKRISDNDSETEELTDDLYFGGAGDCLNVSNSRAATPGTIEESLRIRLLDAENQTRIETEYENNMKALRQELEHKANEIQSIRTAYEKVIEEQKELFECQIRDIEAKHERSSTGPVMHEYCQTEWEALENGELSNLRAAYNHQLQEQIELARQDIVNGLLEQFETLLSVEEDKEDDWPPELLELRDKFTRNAKHEIQELKKTHSMELSRLKNEHDSVIARMLERQKEINLLKTQNADKIQETIYVGSSENSITEERDNLRKTCATLQNLIGELIKYFVVCEEEVNNTLISEVLKKQLPDSVFTGEENLSKDNNIPVSEARCKDISNQSIKRVHFAPQFSKITSIVNSDNKTLQGLIDEDIDEKLKKELKTCLRRLKSDSTEILNFSLLCDKDKIASLPKETDLTNKINEELSLKLDHAEDLIMGYQEETEQLKVHILELQRKLISAESKKEVITEGYGESDLSRGDIVTQDFSQLQEKARHVLSNGGGDSSYLLQLIEELCRQNDKLMDDARKEKEDLQQQVPLEPTPTPYIHRVCCKKIEAADKQLRATRRFLDEQASEREMERDEAAKQIRVLQEQLKEREREKERDMRISSEQSELSSETSDATELQTIDVNATVEALESQMREMSSLMSDTEAKKSEKESELKAAIDKIWVLREIITDLEQQLQVKIEREESLQVQIGQLETVITAQTKNQQELVQELDAIKSGSESRQLNEQISHLEEELHKHKLSSEHFNVNSSVLKQIKAELHEMQNQLDKRIRELESAHMCGSNLSLSQPSEDVSIREQIDAARCLTPDDPTSPPMLPLDQVLKLKDKMLKHARAEDVAFKRIKDLEMQLTTIKNQNEELIAEQEILHQTASEQLFQIEKMRGRLEQHKQSAPFVQKQATSRLELQLHEATTKYHSLEQIITDRELEAKELRIQLDRANQLLAEKEIEMENFVQSEHGALQKLKDQLKLVQEEKKMLQIQLGTQQEHVQLPSLIDTVLADKNEEIDHLKEQLSKKDKQLEAYSSLALNDVQLRDLTKQVEPKNSARTLSDIISIHSECEEFSEAIREPNITHVSHNMSSFKGPTLSKNTLNPNSANSLNALETPLLDKMDTQVPPLDLDLHSPHTQSPSNFLRNSELELHHIEDESKLSSPKNNDNSEDSHQAELLDEKLREIENLSSQLQAMQRLLEEKSDRLVQYEADLTNLNKQHENLHDEYKELVENLVRDKNFYKGQYELTQASENKIKKDLEEVENILKLKVEEFEDHKDRMQVNERILTELNAENIQLKKEIEIREKDQSKKNNLLLQEKTQELQRFKELLLEKDITLETLQTRNIEIENENKQLYDFKTKVHVYEQEIAKFEDEVLRLTDGLYNRDQVIRKLEEMARRTSDSHSSASSSLSHSNKDQEIHHLQEFLKEKDKVIRQMSDDSKSLHRALETIQTKMKESGNVVELRKKLKDERRLNAELKDVVQRLQKELEDLRDAFVQRSQDDSDIEDMVQRELNLSARLDKQLMQVIKDDVEEAGGPSEEHKSNQIYKDNEALRRLKDELEVERDIMKHQIVEYEDRILELKANLAEETKKVAKLNKDLTIEKNTVQFLRMQIDEHRRVTEAGRVQDTELIEFLQTKLKASLENEEKLCNDLTLMNQQHINLDSQLTSMRKLIEVGNVNKTSPKFAATVQNELQSASAEEKSRDNNMELRENIKRLEIEMSRYEKRLEIATEERERLISSLALANGIKEILEADLRRTTEELKTREKQCDYMQKQIQMLTEVENKKQEQRGVEISEIKGLRREVNIARETMVDLETDIKLAKQELRETSERELKLAHIVESLKEREAELNTKLALSKERERKLMELIEDQQTKLSLNKEEDIRDLRSKLSDAKDIPASFARQIKELREKAEKYATERNNFQDKLDKMREDKESLMQRTKMLEGQIKKLKNQPALNQQSVSIERLQNFYGKYLRVESRRKALAFQKKYLLCIIGSYQYCAENTLYVLAQLTQDQRSYTRLPHGKVRLKIIILVVISTLRMKWLIQRRRTGKRVGANALMGCIDQLIDLPPTIKSVSNHSPPVRERTTANGGNELSGFTVEQYYQQVKNFQQTVESAIAESGTSHIISE
ncbi:A-kinase anchor protein 9-like isoform X3 [Odontomachus brunneus]|uniref:A-kinase anchor protein 9-like isoform X3 n=1 Tax=Odontomachus brunneus TaxID=486640 RepID=UPI0013F1E99C|nr:A-kinase anchor protein 9-like isoform X3 [Odontomachus brunneus]